jgi:hypothetical protein
MDQLVALAAAHKSTVVENDADARQLYRVESTRLQNRALANVDLTHEAVNNGNASALFIFSTILGQHVLFDILNDADTLSSMLEKFVRCFDLHRGIRVIASEAHARLHPTFLGGDKLIRGHSLTQAHPQATTQGTECAALLGKLRNSELERQSMDMFCETVQTLQYLFDSLRNSQREWSAIVVQEWLVRVPDGYLSSLRQRRPEALVILAHYAVLLHRARNYWVVGESGRFLIRSISDHLGEYWADWLTWPQQVLEDT